MMNHKIVVIGASAGGVEATTRLVRDLPASLNASVFIVLHLSSQGPSLLPQIFRKASSLTVVQAQDMESIQAGTIYVAPPDFHLIVKRNHIELSKSAKINNSRPAIDSLFISAALAHKKRVIGVVLTGMLDDGSLGLAKIKQYGGLAIVQDPAEAMFPQMPRNAIEATNCDYVLSLSKISERLVQLIEEPIEQQEFAMDEQEFENSDKPNPISQSEHGSASDEIYHRGKPSVYSCPDCGGVLAEIKDDGILRFICRVGHSYSSDWLLNNQSENIERALWTALRSLDESISLSRRMAEHYNDETIKQDYLQKADEYERDGAILRSLLLK